MRRFSRRAFIGSVWAGTAWLPFPRHTWAQRRGPEEGFEGEVAGFDLGLLDDWLTPNELIFRSQPLCGPKNIGACLEAGIFRGCVRPVRAELRAAWRGATDGTCGDIGMRRESRGRRAGQQCPVERREPCRFAEKGPAPQRGALRPLLGRGWRRQRRAWLREEYFYFQGDEFRFTSGPSDERRDPAGRARVSRARHHSRLVRHGFGEVASQGGSTQRCRQQLIHDRGLPAAAALGGRHAAPRAD